jgi:hypothetical protein
MTPGLKNSIENIKFAFKDDILYFLASFIALIYADFLIDSSRSDKRNYITDLTIPYFMVNSVVNFALTLPYLGYALINLFGTLPITSDIGVLLNVRRARFMHLMLVIGLSFGVQTVAFCIFFLDLIPQLLKLEDSLVFI